MLKNRKSQTKAEVALRRFVFRHLANSELGAPILIENMDALVEWLKNGTPPKLKVVGGTAANAAKGGK